MMGFIVGRHKLNVRKQFLGTCVSEEKVKEKI